MADEQLKSEVLISIFSTIETAGTSQNIRQQFEGQLYLREQSCYIRYAEQTEDGEIQHTLKVEKQQLTLLKQGAVRMKQVFRPHTETEGFLQTVYGKWRIKIRTKQLSCPSFRQARSRLNIAYTSQLNEGEESDIQLHIDVSKKNPLG